MNKSLMIKLSTYDQKSNERMLLVTAIGLLHSCETGKISVDEVHAYLFNPYTLGILRKIDASPQLIDFFHHGLFFEDIEDLFPKQKLQEMLVEMKQKGLALLSLYEYKPQEENKWVITDSGE